MPSTKKIICHRNCGTDNRNCGGCDGADNSEKNHAGIHNYMKNIVKEPAAFRWEQ